MAVHHFDSTGEAYDACQCDETIKNGDVLVIESEGVVGLAETWPVAVTASHGELHVVADPSYWADTFTLEQVSQAELEASKRGFELQ